MGTAATFTATVTSTTGAVPVGTVTFKRGPTVLGTVALDATGAASFTTSALPPGNSTIGAIYNNSPNFLTSTNTVRHSALTLPTSTSLVSSINPAASNNFITFTATVINQGATVGSAFAGTPTGSVTFMDGSSPTHR